ncbi:hypothetical protein H2136_22225 [Aeromonas hydrophila]|uniref:Uncharacterized protein n=1 Tax=Aeromonas hydrophila TaxID=644 RepID=A0A926FP67_AERHY|nr:hypothetical protein [Aeromonas hydrophila]
MRITAATCFHEDDYSGKLDIEGHLAKATQVRSAFAGNPLIKADAVKIFLDGVLEGILHRAAFPAQRRHAGELPEPHLVLDRTAAGSPSPPTAKTPAATASSTIGRRI